MDALGLQSRTVAPLPASGSKDGKKIENAAREFEGVLVGQLVQAMLATLGDDVPGGSGEEMFRGVLAEKIGAQVAAGPGIGLSASVMDTMLKTQGEGR